jgi:GTP cyclohydrolase II
MISHSRPQQEQTAPKPQDSAPQDSERALTARLRAVHRAASDLRRGIPVVLRAPGAVGENWLLLAAETAGERGVEELRRLAAVPPVLLLAPTRAAAVLHRPVVSLGGAPEGEAVALRLPAALMIPAALRALADPTLDQARPAEPEALAAAPGTAGSALALAKLGRLLPAVLAAPLAREIADREIAARRLLEAGADEVRAYPEAAALSLLRAAEAKVPLEDAPDARIIAFRVPASGVEHLAILVGRPEKVAVPLVRLHSECFTGDVLGSLRCDCGLQLRGAIKRMGEEGAGILLYLAQEGRGIGLLNKLRAYALQDRGLDTLDANRALGWGADERSFLVAATMLEALGVHQLRLLTNNPDKVEALGACGVSVAERVPLAFAPNGVNDRYLETKARRFGHLLG